ncbi:MAG: beta-lactamase family protein [Alteromonadaceae bacterium]|nr:beta-lactamase family protein [Alteromonadaceae bacterium]
MKKLFFMTMLVLFANYTVQAKEHIEFQWPEHSSTSVFKALLNAYNANDLATLQAFVKKYYPEKSANAKDIYWRQIFSEYGVLKPFKVADEKFHELPAIWFQGAKTKGWLKMVLMVNKEETQILKAGLFRKIRPVGALPPYFAIPEEKMGNYLGNYLETLNQADRFSGAILVAKGDKVLFQQAYGYSDKGRQKKNTLNTAFGIASTTKTFTAVAIMQLVEQGKIKLNDPLSKFISEYPKDIADQVTIHHLLNHTSGLEFDDYEPFYNEALAAKSISEMLVIQLKYIDHLNDERRKDFKVLNEFDYTNDGFILLGAVIERVTGQSYAQYIEKNIFEPVGMKFSVVDNSKLAEVTNKIRKYSITDVPHIKLRFKI